MNNDLIERYIYAVTKKMKSKMRNEVADDLNSLISDMLTERCGEATPSESDIRLVLTELGTPTELYEKYDTDSKKCLIGAPHFSTYKLVLKIVLLCVGGGITLSWLISRLLLPPQFIQISVFQWFDSLGSGLLAAFAFVTILFAILYHRDIRLKVSDSLDSLPPVPKNNKGIPKLEAIVGIAFSVFFIMFFLFFTELIGVYIEPINAYMPIFNIDMMRNTWYMIVLFGGLGIVKATVRLIDGRYTTRVMFITVLANIVSAVIAIIWLNIDGIYNADLIGTIISAIDINSVFIIDFLSNFFGSMRLLFLGVILFALGLDTVTVIIHTFKNR